MTPDQLRRFLGRTKPFAIQTSNGGYVPVHREITQEDLIKHLRGEVTLGTYVIREDGLITFASIDIDGRVGEDMGPYEQLAYYVLELFPEFDRCVEWSGRRGYHVWIFLEQPEVPRFVRELILSRLKTNGVSPKIEVFPKQHVTTGKGLGNLIKLPNGKHQQGGWAKVLRWENGN